MAARHQKLPTMFWLAKSSRKKSTFFQNSTLTIGLALEPFVIFRKLITTAESFRPEYHQLSTMIFGQLHRTKRNHFFLVSFSKDGHPSFNFWLASLILIIVHHIREM
jgi:hypothetical protein